MQWSDESLTVRRWLRDARSTHLGAAELHRHLEWVFENSALDDFDGAKSWRQAEDLLDRAVRNAGVSSASSSVEAIAASLLSEGEVISDKSELALLWTTARAAVLLTGRRSKLSVFPRGGLAFFAECPAENQLSWVLRRCAPKRRRTEKAVEQPPDQKKNRVDTDETIERPSDDPNTRVEEPPLDPRDEKTEAATMEQDARKTREDLESLFDTKLPYVADRIVDAVEGFIRDVRECQKACRMPGACADCVDINGKLDCLRSAAEGLAECRRQWPLLGQEGKIPSMLHDTSHSIHQLKRLVIRIDPKIGREIERLWQEDAPPAPFDTLRTLVCRLPRMLTRVCESVARATPSLLRKEDA